MRLKILIILFATLTVSFISPLKAQGDAAAIDGATANNSDFQNQYYSTLIESGNEFAINEELKRVSTLIDGINEAITFLDLEKTRLNGIDITPCDQLLDKAAAAAKAKQTSEMSSQISQLSNIIYQITVFGSRNTYVDNMLTSIRNNDFLGYHEIDLLDKESEKNLQDKLNNNGEFTRLKNIFGTEATKKRRDDLLKKIDNELNKAKEKLKSLQKNILSLQKASNKKSEINVTAIYLGLPLFCATILILFIGTQWLKLYYGTKDSGNKISTFPSSVLLEISTVLLVTLSILILGLAKLISSEVLGTLLGGISGFVLNRTKDAFKSPKTSKNDNNNQSPGNSSIDDL